MASRQQIKARIGSVKNTRQITKAMELVAASKMRRAQEAVNQTRDYSQTARELLTRLRQLTDVSEFELFQQPKAKGRLLIVIGSDRPLAGAYNSNILKLYIKQLKANAEAGLQTYTIVLGRQVSNVVSRLADTGDVEGVYHDYPERPSADDLRPIISSAAKLFVSGKIEAVDVLYTHYKSAIVQHTTSLRLLPAGFKETEVSETIYQADFEPSAEEVLRSVTMRLLEVQLLQTVLDSVASEHSMRMIAMKNATDNANEIVDDLTLEFNNARQAAITQELAEITGGAEAMA